MSFLQRIDSRTRWPVTESAYPAKLSTPIRRFEGFAQSSLHDDIDEPVRHVDYAPHRPTVDETDYLRIRQRVLLDILLSDLGGNRDFSPDPSVHLNDNQEFFFRQRIF